MKNEKKNFQIASYLDLGLYKFSSCVIFANYLYQSITTTTKTK